VLKYYLERATRASTRKHELTIVCTAVVGFLVSYLLFSGTEKPGLKRITRVGSLRSLTYITFFIVHQSLL
jgi:hypothetical protein